MFWVISVPLKTAYWVEEENRRCFFKLHKIH